MSEVVERVVVWRFGVFGRVKVGVGRRRGSGAVAVAVGWAVRGRVEPVWRE
jgi:hypothetical protein